MPHLIPLPTGIILNLNAIAYIFRKGTRLQVAFSAIAGNDTGSRTQDLDLNREDSAALIAALAALNIPVEHLQR